MFGDLISSLEKHLFGCARRSRVDRANTGVRPYRIRLCDGANNVLREQQRQLEARGFDVSLLPAGEGGSSSLQCANNK